MSESYRDQLQPIYQELLPEGLETPASLFNTVDINAGLWLDKYIRTSDREDKTSRSNLVKQVALLTPPAAYERFYGRWKMLLKDQHALVRKGKVSGRMIVGLGTESVLETSVTLHRTYGVPYIPGSALKGLAASFAQRRAGNTPWQKGGEAYRTVFGDTDEAGYVTFFDALYIPNPNRKEHPLHLDVITVHHPQYASEGAVPADWDSPNPVPFLSTTGCYLIALAAPELEHATDWINQVFTILGQALAEDGIGAKTSSGYGRMKLV